MAIQGFLSDEQEQAVVDSITAAELKTSGEIRLHIENRCKGGAQKRAQQVFSDLKMTQTKDRNGILIYIALLDHKLCIWGDEGFHAKVGQSFWDSEMAQLVSAFKEKQFKEGLIALISKMGIKLSDLFPFQSDDTNELDNSISFNKN